MSNSLGVNGEGVTEGAQTVLKGFSILEAVAAGHTTLQELCAAVGLPRSTAHRLAATLVASGYLRHKAPGRYALGTKLISLGFQAHDELDLVAVAHPHLEELRHLTHETVHSSACFRANRSSISIR